VRVILGSWDKIARHFGKSIRTVQRWEVDFGLPIHRPHGPKSQVVLADEAELDAWFDALPTRADSEKKKR
jgi:hypothetical protein